MNGIVIQQSKCKFIVINAEAGDKDPIPFILGGNIESSSTLDILGTFVSEKNKENNDNHMKKRYKSVIKYLNYIRDK